MFEIGLFASTSLSILQTPVNKTGGKFPSLGVRHRQSIQLKLRLRRDLKFLLSKSKALLSSGVPINHIA